MSLSLQENLFYDAHYRDIYNGYTLYYLKFKSLENKLSGIKNLILGSSHGVYGFLPNNNEFNLCFPSQDLYYALKLYEKYRFKCHNLRTIYLFYSVFSPGFELAESNEKWRCTWYQMFFNIKSQNKILTLLFCDFILKNI